MNKPIVQIEWKDAEALECSQGYSLKEINNIPILMMLSTGKLVFEDEHKICLCSLESLVTNTFHDVIIIPKSNIVNVRYFVERGEQVG